MKLSVTFFMLAISIALCSDVGYFWAITDVHIDLLYKEGSDALNCDGEILCCRKFNPNMTETAPKFGPYTRCDQPQSALQEHLNWIRDYTAQMPVKPDFVLHGGDDSPHDNDVQTRDTNLEASKIVHTMIKSTIPVKIYSTIGNHECFPVDQLQEVPGGSYLMDFFTRLWSSSLPESALRTARKGGYYSVHPVPGLRLITLNTNFWDIINFYLYQNETKDFADHFQWLTEELTDAEAKNEKVYIHSHIPPGYPGYLDGFTTYVNNKMSKYAAIIKRFHKTIIASFHGHKHTDYFQIFYDQNVPVSISLMGSALTPWQGRNPGARLYTYSKRTFEIVDYTEFFTDLGDANRVGKATWQKGYSFREEYGMPDLKPATMHNLLEKFRSDQPLFDKFMFNKKSRYGKPNCSGFCKKNWICLVTSMDIDTYTRCKNA